MALNARQRRFYTHTCNIYSVTRNTNTDGRGTPGPEVITLAYSNVKCFYQFTPNLDDPAEVARFKKASVFTTDIVHFDAEQRVDNGWWLKNTTPGPNYGQVHKILGAANVLPGTSTRHTNKQSIRAMQEETPPAAIG